MDVKKNNAEVYWIRRSIHSDILTEGYVGVSINATSRVSQHISNAKAGRHENDHLSNAILESNDLIWSVVLLGDEECCYFIENKLRPSRNIGWNISEGGFRPPNMRGIPLSENHRNKLRKPKSKLHCENIRKSKLGLNNPMVIHRPTKEHIEKRRNSCSREWSLTSPQGDKYRVHNLREFCTIHDLDHSTLYKVASGGRNHYKGWKCVKESI